MNENTERKNPYTLVVYPDGNYTMMSDKELYVAFYHLIDGREKFLEMRKVPGTDNAYFLIPEENPARFDGALYYKAPALVVAINEEKGKITDLKPAQIKTALEFFNSIALVVERRNQVKYVFCLAED